MHKVIITDYLPPPATIEQQELAGLASVECLLGTSADDVIGRLDDADAIIVFHQVAIPKAVIDTLDRCRAIVRGGVGFDNVDLVEAGRRGIFVCNVPDYGVDEVADHAIALMLACTRGLIRAERTLRHRMEPWDYTATRPVYRIAGATMGIIGLGRIGTATALRAKSLRMRVLACDPYSRPGMDKAVGVEMADLDALLAESDVVSLHVPLTGETRHMIDAAALAKMKPTATLVNTARGAVVDTDALADALQRNAIGGAGIDVLPTEPPEPSSSLVALWREERDPPANLILTPHSAFYSESSLPEIRIKAAQEVARILRGEPPRSCVNQQYL